ncbi:hypothetical protein DP140_26865, partial [Salmonella enterica subsp. enterica serovar Weltevreden]
MSCLTRFSWPWSNSWLPTETRPVGGFAPISKIVKDAKAKEKDVFFFDAGDYFTGPFISTLT